MLCDNCKKKPANVKYSENINGVRRELNLCEDCSRKLGLSKMKLDMTIGFSSFLGDFIEDFESTDFMPMFSEIKSLKCDNCGYSFEDIANTGKVGCAHCYDIFESRLDPIIKQIQSSNLHVGRLGKSVDQNIEKRQSKKAQINNKEKSIEEKIEEKKQQLKQVVKEEKYEEAAKIRDEIKKLEEKNKEN